MILHIANDYSGSTVYMNLVRELDKKGVSQIIYTPVKDESSIGKNRIEFEDVDSRIIYSFILNKTIDRLFFNNKINKIVKDIESRIDLSKIQMIHAHTWYSDGGVAYLLSKKYNIPYIVAIRNTDLNVHFKYFIQHRGLGRKVLNEAQKVILIGKYQKDFFSKRKQLNNIVAKKIKVIPNGVDDFWLANSENFKLKDFKKSFKILYIGTFIKRKYLLQLQDAVINLSINKGIPCELQIVGGNGKETEKILEKIKKYPQLFNYHGIIKDKGELLKIFNDNHVFAMPSLHETFGLVYIEALLQGLPVLYTANEGIDGFYSEKIGEKIHSPTVAEITQKLLDLMRNYESYTIPTSKLLKNHNWKEISEIYRNLYISE